ncbi:armadillo/beta-catenin-like repeat domain-containing protein [Phthorimaea operculella]|nr:armadillo/beta-catenin-like repeat domain-containing protein [Phthorimaea operculella]
MVEPPQVPAYMGQVGHVCSSSSLDVATSGGSYAGGAGADHYGTYGHYGATAYNAQPAYMVEPPQVPAYMGQEYVEGGGSASPRSASPPGVIPSQHNLHLQQRYDSASLEQLGRHYCVTSPRGEYAGDAYGYQHYPAAYDAAQQPFKDSQNGLSLGSAGGQSMYGDEEELQKQMAGMSLVHGGVPVREDAGLQWRDPNLPEVIGFLNSPSDVVKANAAAYLQHLTYMDDPNKQKTRSLGGIPPLVRLVSHETPEVCRNACGALRNLSYGRQNDENKRAIRDAGGIPALMALLCRSTEMEIKELVTGIIWNMSSCEDLKQSIIDDAAHVIVNKIIIPHSGWHPTNPGDTYWSTGTVFRNASGVLRNASSAGEYARRRLRCLPGLTEALLHSVRSAIAANAIGTKIVENCVCVLRNLSYRCQEIEDPLYDTRAPPTQSTGQARIQASASKGENLGCFGGSKKKKDGSSSSNSTSPLGKSEHEHNPLGDSPGTALGYSVPKGTEQLWSPDVVPLYMALLQTCSNPETLEAAAGALQNLAACYWQPSIDIRAAVRKEKGLPILVELLRMEVDRVVCAVATALRNLAIDQRNKELIGKYAMRDLVQKLPSGNHQHDQVPHTTMYHQYQYIHSELQASWWSTNMELIGNELQASWWSTNKELIGKYAMRDLVQKLPSGNHQHDQVPHTTMYHQYQYIHSELQASWWSTNMELIGKYAMRDLVQKLPSGNHQHDQVPHTTMYHQYQYIHSELQASWWSTNKELIGKYAMRDLVQKLPSGNHQHDQVPHTTMYHQYQYIHSELQASWWSTNMELIGKYAMRDLVQKLPSGNHQHDQVPHTTMYHQYIHSELQASWWSTNKELIGKYAMRDLVQKLPSGNHQHDQVPHTTMYHQYQYLHSELQASWWSTNKELIGKYAMRDLVQKQPPARPASWWSTNKQLMIGKYAMRDLVQKLPSGNHQHDQVPHTTMHHQYQYIHSELQASWWSTNKELIGKYAMRDLVQKLPSGNHQHDQGTSDDTIAAVLATLNEVIKKSGEFSRSLLEAGGVERLLNLTKQRQRYTPRVLKFADCIALNEVIKKSGELSRSLLEAGGVERLLNLTKQRQRYTPRVLKFAGQVLQTMWSHAELREVYRKHGWREADFLTPARANSRPGSSSSGQGTPMSGGAPHSPSNANSTLSRPMASTGGTRYEDRTMRRPREVRTCTHVVVRSRHAHSPSNANSTLSRPMASTGGTRYEDRTMRRPREVRTCTHVVVRSRHAHSPSNANSTLSRPMASTGGTRYEDRTMRRPREVRTCTHVVVRSRHAHSPSNANSTLSRPMASTGGTRYEDRTMRRPREVRTCTHVVVRSRHAHSPSNANSTLSRPMASTGGTRYEDRTMRRPREVRTCTHVVVRSRHAHSPSNANSTLSRPMASTGGTRYEDRTMRRPREVRTCTHVVVRSRHAHSPSNANSTLSRPMASTGGTRYEDRTMRRPREVRTCTHVVVRSRHAHSPSNANSTLSRPMASTGGTRYEDRTMRRPRESDEPTMDANNYQDGLGMGNPNGRPMNLQGVQAQMPPPSSR